MKKVITILVLFLLLNQATEAQEPITKTIYLPIITKVCMPLCLPIQNSWRIIKPVGTTNMILNPSGEITGNFSAQGAATVTRSTTYQKYGLYSYNVITTGNGQGISLTLSALTNSVHWFTARIRKTIDPPELRFSIGPSSQKPILLEKIDDNWDLWGTPFGATESNGQTTATITQFGPGSGNIYIDGLQIEAQADWTTFCDGTQEGCAWNGAEHAATSTRSALSPAGGIPQDLYEEYRFFVQRVVGAGSATQTLNVDSYAILPGGELNSIKVESRQFSLIGKFITDTEQELHDYRQDLEKLLKRLGTVKLRFNGARVQKEITVVYQGGLEGDLAAFYQNFEAEGDNRWVETYKFIEKASIQWLAPDPYWRETGESAALLDVNQTDTFRIVAGRIKDTGQWDSLGPPSAAGTYTDIRAIAEDATYVYFGGDFQNFDGIANADYIVRYHKQTGVYSALDVGLGNTVLALAIAPNGDLYIGGTFENAGGVAAADFLCRWDGANFNAVGTPNVGAASIGSVNALIFDHAGILFIGGSFVNWANDANADRIVSWDGANYHALSTGVNNEVDAFAVGPDNTLYITGDFTAAAGVGVSRIVSWNGSAFSALGSGLNAPGSSLAISPDGLLYVGGNFGIAGGVTVNGFTVWNGTAFSALGGGVDPAGAVFALSVGPDNVVLIGGDLGSVGTLTLADKIARWNGYAYAHLDIDLPSIAIAYAFYPSKFTDPVVKQKYDLFVGFDTTGTGSFAGLVTVDNGGNVPAFPKIIFERSSTGLPATIQTLKNETTGKELLFNYSLLAGERLTIDLTPTKKSIISNFFGPRSDAILANSDFGSWVLEPDSQDVSCFVNVQGALYGEAAVSWLLWRESYDSWD